jgi:hypothetical protein
MAHFLPIVALAVVAFLLPMLAMSEDCPTGPPPRDGPHPTGPPPSGCPPPPGHHPSGPPPQQRRKRDILGMLRAKRNGDFMNLPECTEEQLAQFPPHPSGPPPSGPPPNGPPTGPPPSGMPPCRPPMGFFHHHPSGSPPPQWRNQTVTKCEGLAHVDA